MGRHPTLSAKSGTCQPAQAQWKQAYYKRGGRVADSEGFLAVTQDAVIFSADSGAITDWPYQDIRGYSLKNTWRPGMRKLTLLIGGSQIKLGVEEQAAANAEYILRIKTARFEI